MPATDRVYAVVVHYQTPDLLETAVRSFCGVYPAIPVLVVDNGSEDASRTVIEDLRREFGSVSALLLDRNVYHGPAMDRAIRAVESDYVFLLDSDTVTKAGGFLEEMVQLCEPEPVYAVGQVVDVNRRGFAAGSGTPVTASAYMLIDRAKYLSLPPFIHHGLPVLQNFQAASEAGYRVVDYPIARFIEHLGRGTAERYGYGLGIRSRIDYLLHKLGL